MSYEEEHRLADEIERRMVLQPVERVHVEVVSERPREERDKSKKRVTVEEQFRQFFGEGPLPLTADKLRRLVCRCDYVGPWRLGAFYPARLRQECGLLLPRPVWGLDDPALTVLLDTWAQNFMFFRCRAIGGVLACYEMMRWENVYCKVLR